MRQTAGGRCGQGHGDRRVALVPEGQRVGVVLPEQRSVERFTFGDASNGVVVGARGTMATGCAALAPEGGAAKAGAAGAAEWTRQRVDRRIGSRGGHHRDRKGCTTGGGCCCRVAAEAAEGRRVGDATEPCGRRRAQRRPEENTVRGGAESGCCRSSDVLTRIASKAEWLGSNTPEGGANNTLSRSFSARVARRRGSVHFPRARKADTPYSLHCESLMKPK